MPNFNPLVNVNFEEVKTRDEVTSRVLAEFSAEVARLSPALADARLERANLLAAARATLAAYDEGEPDPLSYLRDELAAQSVGRERRPA